MAILCGSTDFTEEAGENLQFLDTDTGAVYSIILKKEFELGSVWDTLELWVENIAGESAKESCDIMTGIETDIAFMLYLLENSVNAPSGLAETIVEYLTPSSWLKRLLTRPCYAHLLPHLRTERPINMDIGEIVPIEGGRARVEIKITGHPIEMKILRDRKGEPGDTDDGTTITSVLVGDRRDVEHSVGLIRVARGTASLRKRTRHRAPLPTTSLRGTNAEAPPSTSASSA